MNRTTNEQLAQSAMTKVYTLVTHELWNLASTLYQLKSLERYDTTTHVILDDISNTAIRVAEQANAALCLFQEWKAEHTRTDTTEVQALSASDYAVRLQERVSGKLGD